MNFEDDVFKVNKIFYKIFPEINKIDDLEWFGALIGQIIDVWGAENDIPEEELSQFVHSLGDAHDFIYNKFGPAGFFSASENKEEES